MLPHGAEDLAVLAVTSYDHWWNRQIKSRVPNPFEFRKRRPVVRETAFDDEFVRGMTDIFNETPRRQGAVSALRQGLGDGHSSFHIHPSRNDDRRLLRRPDGRLAAG
jgi:hypothetical protein